MDKETPLLMAWCRVCSTTVGHDMTCACPSAAYLNQDEPISPEEPFMQGANLRHGH